MTKLSTRTSRAPERQVLRRAYTCTVQTIQRNRCAEQLTGSEGLDRIGLDLDAFADGLPGGFFIYEAHGEERILFANRQMEEIFRCDSKEDFLDHVGGTFPGIVYHEDRLRVENNIWAQINAPDAHAMMHYIGTDACACNLMRPAMYGAYHHITVLGKEDAPETELYDVTGSLCENNDKFAVDRMLPEISMGDYLFIHDTGAHGYAMGYNYNGKLRSAELLLKTDGTVEMIRRAETPADYFATFDFCDILKKYM